jgi:hypothetical protein
MRRGLFPIATVLLALSTVAHAQAPAAGKQTWKPVAFAIVKYNDEAPKSWNLYHTEKKGILLLHLWRRYLLVDTKDEEVYDIDPGAVKEAGPNVEFDVAAKPAEPLESGEWKTRDVGPTRRIRFKLSKDGNIVELQIPLQINGKPAY